MDGVAVVSAIMSAKQPQEAARELSKITQSFFSSPSFLKNPTSGPLTEKEIILSVASLLTKVRETGPVVHQVYIHFLYIILWHINVFAKVLNYL